MVHQTISKYSIALLLLAMPLLHSCYYDVEEELYPSTTCNTATMSYQNDVLPILTNSGCISCHGDLATIDLNGYTDVKIHVDNGSLLGSIKHESSYRAMPDNQPKLDKCTIDKIAAWIADGAANN